MGRDDDRKRKYRRKDSDRYDRDNDRDHRHKEGLANKLVEKTFGLADSPLSYTILKGITTGVIGFTTVASLAVIGGFKLAGVGSLALPAIAIAAGALTTAAVWIFGTKGQASPVQADESQDEELMALSKKITELEERLTNVEIIESFENRLARKELAQDQFESLDTGETTYSETPRSLSE